MYSASMCELCAYVRELREVASRKEQCIFKPSLSVVRGLYQQVQLTKPASLLVGPSCPQCLVLYIKDLAQHLLRSLAACSSVIL